MHTMVINSRAFPRCSFSINRISRSRSHARPLVIGRASGVGDKALNGAGNPTAPANPSNGTRPRSPPVPVVGGHNMGGYPTARGGGGVDPAHFTNRSVVMSPTSQRELPRGRGVWAGAEPAGAGGQEVQQRERRQQQQPPSRPGSPPSLESIPPEVMDHGQHISFLTAPMSVPPSKEQQERERRLEQGRRGMGRGGPGGAGSKAPAPAGKPPSLDSIPEEVIRGGRHVSMLTAPWAVPPPGMGLRGANRDGAGGGADTADLRAGAGGEAPGQAAGGSTPAAGAAGARAWGVQQPGASSGASLGAGTSGVGADAPGRGARLFPPLAASSGHIEAGGILQLGGGGGGDGGGSGGGGGGGGQGWGRGRRGGGSGGEERQWWQHGWGLAALALGAAGVAAVALSMKHDDLGEED